MPQKLPMISGKEAVKAFSRGGWHVDRIAGSHAVMRKEGCAVTLCATSSGTEKRTSPLFDERCRHRFRGIPDVLDYSGIIRRLLYHLLDALKRHQGKDRHLAASRPAVARIRSLLGEL